LETEIVTKKQVGSRRKTGAATGSTNARPLAPHSNTGEMTMNPKRLMTLVAAVLTFCLLPLEQSTSAVNNSGEVKDKHCRKVKATAIDGISGGTITRGGILNGTTEFVFTSDFLPGPTPTTVSFTADYTITTNGGVLKTHSVYIYDFARLLATAISQIDPDTSTGVFTRATGVLYFNAKSTDGGATVQSKITGEICFVHDNGEDENEDDDDDR
jgi:hypothetical protein